MLDSTRDHNQEPLLRLGVECDSRLLDLWTLIWEHERQSVEQRTGLTGWLLDIEMERITKDLDRTVEIKWTDLALFVWMTFVNGNDQALTEPESERGTLYRDLGYPVPRRRSDVDAVSAATAPVAQRRACEG